MRGEGAEATGFCTEGNGRRFVCRFAGGRRRPLSTSPPRENRVSAARARRQIGQMRLPHSRDRLGMFSEFFIWLKFFAPRRRPLAAPLPPRG